MDIAQRREIVSRFLRRCVTYADASIERKKSRNEDPLDISNWEIIGNSPHFQHQK